MATINGPPAGDVLFEVLTPLGFTVRASKTYWDVIVTIKLPVMAGRERPERWVCAVAKRLNGDGFLITAYPTDVVKEGVQVWPV